ncbi:hypothetical protein [Microbacterium sp. NPDC089695]|uniref:hypothetical protein n=1 Tax=Microbacterium sp. NPDC089695 TaxID=3364198 RepID=UPI00382B7228
MLLLSPIAEPLSSPPAWAVLHALALLRAAGAELDDAAPVLIAVRADSQWRSDGVEALQETIQELLSRTRAASAGLADRVSELQRVPA